MADLFLSHPEVQPADLRLRTRGANVTAVEYARTALAAVGSPVDTSLRSVAYGRFTSDLIPTQVAQGARHLELPRGASVVVPEPVSLPTRVLGYTRRTSAVTELLATTRRTTEVARRALASVRVPVATLLTELLANRRPIHLRVEASGLMVVELGTVEHLG